MVVYAALACSTCSISSRPRCRTRGSPDGELIVTTSPDERVIVSYLEVSIGKLFAGICKALVCAAAVYSVFRRYHRNALLVQRKRDWM